MAGIGNEEYPELTLTQTVEIAEKVGRQNVKTTSGLAEVMGLKSTNSGYFYHQVSALTKYFGVINRTKDSVQLTPLGQRIAHPLTDADRRLALAEAAGRVTLLQSLYDALGQSFHDADFRTKLRDVTGAALPEIEKVAPYVERLYRDAIPYLAQVAPSGEAPSVGPSLVPLHEEGRNRPSGSHAHESGFRTFEGDGVYLKVKSDPDALEEAEAVIRAWMDREKKRPKKSAASATDKTEG